MESYSPDKVEKANKINTIIKSQRIYQVDYCTLIQKPKKNIKYSDIYQYLGEGQLIDLDYIRCTLIFPPINFTISRDDLDHSEILSPTTKDALSTQSKGTSNRAGSLYGDIYPSPTSSTMEEDYFSRILDVFESDLNSSTQHYGRSFGAFGYCFDEFQTDNIAQSSCKETEYQKNLRQLLKELI